MVNRWKFALIIFQPLLLFLYQTQHKQYLSIENGSLVNRWKLALMVFQLLLLFLYQTQHKQYLSIENGTLVNRRKCAFMMLQPLLLFLYQTQYYNISWLQMEHWSIVGRPKHIVEGGRLLGKHNITLSRLPSPPTQKGTSNFMIVSSRNTIIMGR